MTLGEGTLGPLGAGALAVGGAAVAAQCLCAGALNEAMVDVGVRLFENGALPDAVTRAGMRKLLAARREEQRACGEGDVEKSGAYMREFVADIKTREIAEQTKAANEQHYEVDTRFYNIVLGSCQKYSSALYPPNTPRHKAAELLDEAEVRMLRLYAERAQITKDAQGLRLLDLGCGWGSVSLWFAENFPNVEVVGFSNSGTQRAFIEGEAARRGLSNLSVITGDICNYNAPAGAEKFDRVISIEMFEHMKNYEKLMGKVAEQFLKPGGLLFVHIFVHRCTPYHFIDNGPSDWMTHYFFSGGTMPSDDLLLHFQRDLSLVDQWRVNGVHYSLTLEAWLQKQDANKAAVMPILAECYGKDEAAKWFARWRGFFLACSELFHWDNGNEWYVSHYLFKKPEAAA
eukprot:TRINITY_DN2223_c0_g1_i6.p2 TRINITY_DN2223_c0_g1~~TRINITY_DN2223_c0_g1_i6.p2  ORF type:complete len:401 (+),score=169.78 TRINITY_DN2223_c0_g1_i6:93-1295(+)